MIIGDYLLPLDMDLEAVAMRVLINLEFARPFGCGYNVVTTRITEPMHLLLKFVNPVVLDKMQRGTLIVTKHSHLAAVSHPSCQLQYSCTSLSPPSA